VVPNFYLLLYQKLALIRSEAGSAGMGNSHNTLSTLHLPCPESLGRDTPQKIVCGSGEQPLLGFEECMSHIFPTDSPPVSFQTGSQPLATLSCQFLSWIKASKGSEQGVFLEHGVCLAIHLSVNYRVILL
jgi:hypothetical protein